MSESEQIALLNQMPASAQNPPTGSTARKHSHSGDAFTNWLIGKGYKVGQDVQPSARFWRFQLIEGGWLLALSALLIGGAAGLVRRRGA